MIGNSDGVERVPQADVAAERIDRRVVEVCDAVGAYIETWGFRSIHGRVWSLLALSAVPLSQAQIAERLGVSRSLVHLAIGELGEYALVRPVSERRNAPYTARMDVWPTITGVLRKREWMQMETARVALEALRHELPEAPGRYDPARVELLLAMTELAQAALRALFAVRIPPAPDAFGAWLGRARDVTDGLRRHLPRLLRLRRV